MKCSDSYVFTCALSENLSKFVSCLQRKTVKRIKKGEGNKKDKKTGVQLCSFSIERLLAINCVKLFLNSLNMKTIFISNISWDCILTIYNLHFITHLHYMPYPTLRIPFRHNMLCVKLVCVGCDLFKHYVEYEAVLLGHMHAQKIEQHQQYYLGVVDLGLEKYSLFHKK